MFAFVSFLVFNGRLLVLKGGGRWRLGAKHYFQQHAGVTAATFHKRTNMLVVSNSYLQDRLAHAAFARIRTHTFMLSSGANAQINAAYDYLLMHSCTPSTLTYVVDTNKWARILMHKERLPCTHESMA